RRVGVQVEGVVVRAQRHRRGQAAGEGGGAVRGVDGAAEDRVGDLRVTLGQAAAQLAVIEERRTLAGGGVCQNQRQGGAPAAAEAHLGRGGAESAEAGGHHVGGPPRGLRGLVGQCDAALAVGGQNLVGGGREVVGPLGIGRRDGLGVGGGAGPC